MKKSHKLVTKNVNLSEKKSQTSLKIANLDGKLQTSEKNINLSEKSRKLVKTM